MTAIAQNTNYKELVQQIFETLLQQTSIEKSATVLHKLSWTYCSLH
ncbi:MAG: hypothetical protein EZS26_001502 [Candidatus Ordinivivax streblomastigis]|uniref:Uncharacterized protein n=1 Tax=Candidatus Ordinivivax streblomastigis TaxID=2540710 RepID=A0A5M8P1S9_9BACT|nr:MAG: hypothetical protein EZS26_001502 [Candidatus Ordinivivax streblomastigis]